MFLVYSELLALTHTTFGKQLPSDPQPDFVIVFMSEINKSAMGAERFFEYVYECWSVCSVNTPEAFFVVDDVPKLEDLITRKKT